MRCYFMRAGHVDGVETVMAADDAGHIAQAHHLFDTLGKQRKAEGFEVWEGVRLVYRFPPIRSQD